MTKRQRKKCKIAECEKFAQQGGLCKRHNGGRRCQREGCKHSADGKTNFCRTHGTVKCKAKGCSNAPYPHEEFCARHGSGPRCTETGCNKAAVRGEVQRCKRHGGGVRCVHPGCETAAGNGGNCCLKHGAGRPCKKVGCQGTVRVEVQRCKRHGGAKVCAQQGCTTSAFDGYSLCKAHGGGEACKYEGCSKRARNSSAFCVAHGGDSCAHPNCTKSKQGASIFCIEHSGGTRCVSCAQFSVRRAGQLCYTCRTGTERMKQLENEVKQLLLSWDIHWSLHDARMPCSSGGCAKRPDFVFHIGKWILVLECDEHYHRYYEVSCEISRIGILKDNLKLPLVVIRLNPGVRNYEKLKEVLDKLLTSDGSLPLK